LEDAGRSPPKLAVIMHADFAGSTECARRNESIAHDRIHDASHRPASVMGQPSPNATAAAHPATSPRGPFHDSPRKRTLPSNITRFVASSSAGDRLYRQLCGHIPIASQRAR